MKIRIIKGAHNITTTNMARNSMRSMMK